MSIDDAARNRLSEYTMSSLNNLSMDFYCKYINNLIQPNADEVVTYTADANTFLLVDYPNLIVRGYVNYNGTLYFTTSGQIKIKRSALGNQTIEFVNLKVKAGADEHILNGTVNLPKS